MRLHRAHGLGNDYLVLADGPPLTSTLVRALCDRHRGPGGDGVLEPLPPRDGCAHAVRIWNPDGSEAEKSGNGLRIFAHTLVGWGRAGAPSSPSRFDVWTAGGRVSCIVDGDLVRVDMGVARIVEDTVLAGVAVTRVDVGNPHAVVLGWRDDWRAVGAAIEQAVPGRTNVQFVEVRAGIPHARIWERGAGETLASGSSACAVAVVSVRRGWVPEPVPGAPVTVRMEGGDLRVFVATDGRVAQEGPVEAVGEVRLDPRWLAARGVTGA
jgi:diaminopimelate epimerase